MKAIEFLANGKPVQFTAKALIINGKEYLYTGISNIKHSSQLHVYIFRYDNQWVDLKYSQGDEKALGTLFARIVKLNQTRVAKAKADAKAAEAAAKADVRRQNFARETLPPGMIPGKAINVDPSQTITGEETFQAALSKEIRRTDAEKAAQEVVANEQAEIEAAAAAELEAETGDAISNSDTVSDADTKAETEPDTDDSAEADAESKDNKLSRLKKALIVFGIIIVAFTAAAIAYFFVFGQSDDPSVVPNKTDSQQYNDIDELIDDLQN